MESHIVLTVRICSTLRKCPFPVRLVPLRGPYSSIAWLRSVPTTYFCDCFICLHSPSPEYLLRFQFPSRNSFRIIFKRYYLGQCFLSVLPHKLRHTLSFHQDCPDHQLIEWVLKNFLEHRTIYRQRHFGYDVTDVVALKMRNRCQILM